MKRTQTALLGLVTFLLLLTGAIISVPVSHAQVTGCPSDITHYWKLDDASSPYLDFSGGNSADCTVCPTATTGIVNNAQQFSSTTKLVAADDNTFDWGATDSFSIEVWMKTDSASTCAGNQVMVGRKNDTTGIWWVGCEDGGKAEFDVMDKNGTVSTILGNRDLTDGLWHHVVAVRDAGANEIRLYVDGFLENVKAVSFTTAFDFSKPLNIGWLNYNEGYHFDGVLDEIAIYNRALSGLEIRSHSYLARDYCGMCSTPVRIMPVGDSITTGASSLITDNDFMVSYRQVLYLDLVGAASSVDFVGALKSGALESPPFDIDHEGHMGIMASCPSALYGEVVNKVYDWLTANPAEVVLLHIGTNDIAAACESVNGIASILDEIDRYSKDITVVLALIINQRTPVAAVTSFNDSVLAMAQARIVKGDKIIIVDQENALTYPGDMQDILHPTQAGYDKMAGVWFTALSTFMPICGNRAPVINSTPSPFAVLNKPYTYRVAADGYPLPSYQLTAAPSGMTIDAVSGLVQWTPVSLGNNGVTVKASNPLGTDTQSYSLQVVSCPSGMTHYWKLDDAVSPYRDFYDGDNASCADCPAAATGISNDAQKFALSNEVAVNNDSTFNWSATESFSIAFWMKTDSASTCSGNQVMVGRKNVTKGIWWVGCEEAGGRAEFDIYDKNGIGASIVGIRDLTDGNWHHVVAERDAAANQIRLYVDGVLENTKTVLFTTSLNFTKALNIGWLNFNQGYHFDGTLDEVAVIDRALTSMEVYQHYTAGLSDLGYCDSLAPSIISTPVTTANELVPYSYTVAAIGNPAPTFSLTIAPSGMTINAATGVISWTPAAGQAGSTPVTVTATNISGTVSQPFVITVTNFASYTLNITAVNGSVVKTPDQSRYVVGSNVELTATADSGYTFTGWSGDLTGVSNPQSVVMTADKNITANFAALDYWSVIAPIAGGIIPSGENYRIQWTAPAAAVSFKLLYSIDGGTTWTLISKDIPGRSYSWSVPPLVKNNGNCRIKVVGFTGTGVKVGKIVSEIFTMKGVAKLVLPDGDGLPLLSGSRYIIEWETSPSVAGSVAKVVLKYSKNGGSTWNTIKTLPENAGEPANPGSFEWTVPVVPKTKANCLVKVALKNSSGVTIGSDVSDLPFTIQP